MVVRCSGTDTSTTREEPMDKKTPLYDAHVAAGGKMVSFAGYQMAVEYKETGLIKEHMAVRTQCGIFDVSHMGEVTFKGPDALAAINHLFTNSYDSMAIGKCRYGIMCNEEGGVVDDLITYRRGEDDFLVVVNAATHDGDVKWIKDHLTGDVEFEDISDSIGQVALQGPLAQQILERVAPADQLPTGYYTFREHVPVTGVDCLVSRTGYTGEDGFEIYCPAADTRTVWDALLEAGKPDGLVPAGLGARDTLRLEAGMPLYGNDMDTTVNPIEAALDFAVKLDKPEFIGRDAIAAKGASVRRRVGIEATGRGIIREHEEVFVGDKLVGHTTSGTFCPYLKKSIAMVLMDADYTDLGTEVEVAVRKRRVPAKVVKLPFYSRKK